MKRLIAAMVLLSVSGTAHAQDGGLLDGSLEVGGSEAPAAESTATSAAESPATGVRTSRVRSPAVLQSLPAEVLVTPPVAQSVDPGESRASSDSPRDASADAGLQEGAGLPAEDSVMSMPRPVPAMAEGVINTLSELIFERTEHAEAEAHRATEAARRANDRLTERERHTATPTTGRRDLRLRVVDDAGGIGGWQLPDPRIKTSGLLGLGLFVGLIIWLLVQFRGSLPERGLLPWATRASLLFSRLTLLVMAIMLGSRLLPEWLRPGLLLAMGAVAVTVGAGAVVILLPDLVGGLLLLTEGRLRRGLWVVGDGFKGTVVSVGPRLTVLRGPDGAEVTIPNRRVVQSSIEAQQRSWHRVEVDLQVSAPVDTRAIRQAIEQSVLSSPYVPVAPALELVRNPTKPAWWTVRVRVLDERYEDRFAGQLLERIEEALPREDAD